MNKNSPSVTLIVVAFFSQVALADVYKCELPGGRIEYQPMPCAIGKTSVVRVPASPTQSSSGAPPRIGHAEGLQRKFSLQDGITLRLPSVPLKIALQSIADISGNILVVDPSITEIGSFEYENVPGNVLLADISRRYNVSIKKDSGVITVTRP